VSDATLFQIKLYRWRFTAVTDAKQRPGFQTPYNLLPKTKATPELSDSGVAGVITPKIIAAVAVAFVSAVFFVRLPADRDPDPGPARLRPARHLGLAAAVAPAAAAVVAAAAGVVVVVAAEAADH